ncbi:hypothetical protein KUCAC02_034891, partial [Chaenocephalus aceratus]
EKEDWDIVVQAVLPEKRVRRKKAMPGELSEDEPVSDAEADYRIKVHTVSLDTVTESIQSRYAANGPFLYFPKIKEMGLPTEALQKLSECLQKYDERATAGRLQAELSSLANCWERLKMPHLDAYNSVACERTFSTLKYVKNRLRTTLTQEHMEAFMLMCPEKEILMALDTDGVMTGSQRQVSCCDTCWILIAALHFNENANRVQGVTKAGEAMYSIKYPKGRREQQCFAECWKVQPM